MKLACGAALLFTTLAFASPAPTHAQDRAHKSASTHKARAKRAVAAKKTKKAEDAAAPKTKDAKAEAAGEKSSEAPSTLAADSSDDAAEIKKEGGTQVKVVEFSGLDIDGQLKTPQMLYFLNRLRAEFGRPRLPHRSFMPELQRSTKDKEILMAEAVQSSQRQLRTAMLWNGSLYAEELLAEPRAVTLAANGGGMFPLPEGAVAGDALTLLEPNGLGYVLQPNASLGGFVWLAGERRSVRELSAATRLGPDDYGVVTLGNISVFFQHVRPAEQAHPARLSRDSALVACFGLSVFVHVAILVFLFFVAAKEFAPTESLELDTELVKKFLVVPPPEDEPLVKKHKAGTETEEPGLRDHDDTGAKKHEHEEGRVGRKDATREDTQIAGEPKDAIALKVRGLGLLGVLAGGGPQNALSSALDAPSLDKMLGGLGAVQTVAGRGSGGFGLRGSGSGGGGTGQGSLFGAGDLGTGVGAGNGSGKGRGAGGIGVPGAKAREAQLSLDNGGARVSGFLSKEQIDRVVRANQAAIKYCFEVEMQRQPKLEGAVSMNWRIDRDGHVSTVRVAKSTLGNARVEGCMARQIKRWTFPRPDGGEVEVTYPFLLRGN